MRRSVTMRLDPEVLKAAREKALKDNRSLTNYVETLMRRDLTMGPEDPFLEVIAPPDIRDYEAFPVPGESEEDLKRRDDVFFAVLDASGH